MEPALTLRLLAEPAKLGWREPFAGGELLSDVPLRPDSPPCALQWAPAAAERESARPWRLVYDGPGLVHGELEPVCAETAEGRCRVRFADGETFLVEAPDASGTLLIRRSHPSPRGLAASLERALGAPIALALATHRIWLLHASAVAGASGVVALTARSGGGKSTLAAAAANLAGLGLRRVADDQLPVRFEPRPSALPHYPQLKLALTSSYPRDGPADLPLRAVVAIDHAADGPRVPQLVELSPTEACLELVRSTASARLFDATRASAHLTACAGTAARVRVLQLRFRSGPAELAAALSQIASLLS